MLTSNWKKIINLSKVLGSFLTFSEFQFAIAFVSKGLEIWNFQTIIFLWKTIISIHPKHWTTPRGAPIKKVTNKTLGSFLTPNFERLSKISGWADFDFLWPKWKPHMSSFQNPRRVPDLVTVATGNLLQLKNAALETLTLASYNFATKQVIRTVQESLERYSRGLWLKTLILTNS